MNYARLEGLFRVSLEEKLVALETKYQIPAKGSQAMSRLVEQVRLAAAKGSDVVVFSAKKLGPKALKNRENLLRELTGAVDAPLKIISGFSDLAIWLAQTAGEACL